MADLTAVTEWLLEHEDVLQLQISAGETATRYDTIVVDVRGLKARTQRYTGDTIEAALTAAFEGSR